MARLKNDKAGAAILGQLPRADLLPEAWIAPPQFLLGIADPGDQRACVPDQGESGVRQLDRARSAFDQRQVHRPFQGRDVLAHRRLRHLEGTGGAGEGAAGRGALQHLQPPDMGYKFC